MPAFVTTRIPAKGFRFLRNPAPALDPAGFDTVSAQVFFRGTVSDFLKKFALGETAAKSGYTTAPQGSTLYCLGPQGDPEVKFGHITADIQWKGIFATPTLSTMKVDALGDGNHAKGVSLAMTTQETLWPRQSGDNTIALGTPYAPSPALRPIVVPAPGGGFITIASVPWRVRLIGRAYTASVRGITLAPREVIMRPPDCTIPDPTINDGANLNWQALPDPLVTWSKDTGSADGWCCRNYQRQSEYAVGDKVLAFWNADYEWIERFGP